MNNPAWDIHTVSEEWLVELCENLLKKKITIGGCDGGDKVVKLSDNIAAKFGMGVTASEARTQEFAWRKTDPNIVHIPKVYRYFRYQAPEWTDSCGYLFMEYVPGQLLKDIDLNEHTDIIPRVAKIIAHLGSIQGGQVPGPIGGGYAHGYQWGDDGSMTIFTCVADLENWLNERLKMRDKSIDLSSHPLVLCHMDLCRRNMVLKENNMISLLDWGCAGLYPRFFESATLSYTMPYDKSWEDPLIEATIALLGRTEEEKDLIYLLNIAQAIALRYTFRPRQKSETPDRENFMPPLPPLLSRSPSPS